MFSRQLPSFRPVARRRISLVAHSAPITSAGIQKRPMEKEESARGGDYLSLGLPKGPILSF